MKSFNHYEGGLVNRDKQVLTKLSDVQRTRTKRQARRQSAATKKATALLKRMGW